MNNELSGFRLIEKRFIKEVNADCLFYMHEKSGARLLKIAANDPNKTFCIAFKTLPDSDNGAPHILEHSVLNGSDGFPVRSPFDVLLKGSLHTFMNAFTGKDFTMYPVASMNEKDYFNLMHVYLDAVFNPLIYKDPRILDQEGWHYELEDDESPVVYKGVVYNEMKGSFSNPVRELWYQVFQHLFPGHVYGFESGGYPSVIPTLTNEQFTAFHRRFYHPENSYIFLYGDGNPEKELEFLDRHYLARYEKTGKTILIPDQKPFAEIKDVTGYYPVAETDTTENQTYISINWVAGNGADRALTMSFDILCEVLVNQESAPLRLALQKAGIGQDVSASSGIFNQNVLQFVVRDANPSDKEKFLEIVRKTLTEVVENGLDKKEVEGVLNRMEFLLREGNDAQKGMTYIEQSYPGFLYVGDPFRGLQYEKPLEELKTALTSGYLERIIRDYFLNNTHSLVFTLEPEPGLENKISATISDRLKEYKSGLDSDTRRDLIKKTKDLIEYQKREDSPEALASVPMLDIQDIETQTTWYTSEKSEIEGIPILFHEEFTNDVVYANLYFDLGIISTDLLSYASLLSNMIGLLDTEQHSYGELNQLLNIHTGGFYTSLSSFLEDQEDEKMMPKFVVTSKVMNGKIDKLFEFAGEILLNTRYDDTERIKTLLARHLSQLDAAIKRAGNRFSSIRLASYYSNQGMFRELTEGLEYYWFVNDLVKKFDKNSGSVKAKLRQVAALIFTKSNLVVATTCGKSETEPFSRQLTGFLQKLNAGLENPQKWIFNPRKKNEGIATASQVQYVMAGYNFKKLGYSWDGRMRVLNQVISTDWLQTRLRVMGGAYGGYSTVSPAGFFTFNSYRDPNLKETLENFSGTTGYLHDFKADEKTMTRYIIGTIASIDHPLTPSQKGDHAVSNYFTGRTKEDLQKERDAILNVKAEDIRNFDGMIRDILEQKNICVFGNEDKISQEKDIFDRIITLGK